MELIQVKEERERERPRTFSRRSCRCRNEANSPFLSSPRPLSLLLSPNEWLAFLWRSAKHVGFSTKRGYS